MKRYWKGDFASAHHNVTATLSHALKAMFRQEIAQLRAGKDA